MSALEEHPFITPPGTAVTCEYWRPNLPACGSTDGLVRIFWGVVCREHLLPGAQIYEVLWTSPAPLTGPGLVVADDGTLRAPGVNRDASPAPRAAAPVVDRSLAVVHQLPDPGRAASAVHAVATDTEAQAAALVMGRTGKPRRRLLERIAELGDHGMTSWEAWTWYRATHGPIDLYSLRPRLTELKRDGWLVDSGKVRHPRGNGASSGAPAEEVLVLSDRGRRELDAQAGAR